MNFHNLFSKLSKGRFPYEPLITIEVSRSRLLHNLAEFRKIAPRNAGLSQSANSSQGSIAPVLKSNAYGHGLFEIASILEDENKKQKKMQKKGGASGNGNLIPFFVIDSYFEAVALRSKGIRTPLLIIGYSRPDTIVRSHLKDVAFTMTSLDELKQLSEMKADRKIHIHIKIDTGMHRQGILPEEIDQAIGIIKKLTKNTSSGSQNTSSHIILDGICSHLSDADNTRDDDSDRSFTKTQIDTWNNIAKKFKIAFPSIKYIHLSNTSGHRFSSMIDANISRLGIGLYGLSENQDQIFAVTTPVTLLPVMEMKTIITSLKPLKKGEAVGYSNTFRAPTDMTIATIPVGYFEGIDRQLSNAGTILVGDERIPCPIIGRVSMNITSIDVSAINNPHREMPAIVFSRNPSDPNSIQAIAKKSNTISYEIAVYIPAHLKRVVIE